MNASIETLFHPTVRWFSGYAIFASLAFETPILTLFLRQKQLDFTEISALFSIFAVGVFLFEYITGILADRFSRKGCLLLSGAFMLAGELLFIFGQGFAALAAAMLCMAVSVAAKSGADTALIYDTLAACAEKDSFNEYMSRLGSLLLVIEALILPIGSALAGAGLWVPFAATTAAVLVSLAYLLRMPEPPQERPAASAAAIFTRAMSTAARQPLITALLLIAVLLFPFYHILNSYLQPYLQNQGVAVVYFGFFYTAITLAQAAGTRISAGLARRIRPGYLLILSGAAIGAGYLLLGLPISGAQFAAPLALGFAFGVFYTVGSFMLNHAIDSEVRASTISLQHALTKISQAALFPLFGLLTDRGNISLAFVLFGGGVLALLALTAAFYRKPLAVC